jgi:hypothetical protein
MNIKPQNKPINTINTIKHMESISGNIYKSKKVNSINTIVCEIEETFMGNYSIIVYDTEGSGWVEKFAPTYKQAQNLADSLFLKICKQY